MKRLELPSVAEARLLMKTAKTAIRQMEWVKKPTAADPPWVQYECACFMVNEVREDVIFRMQYRHSKSVVVGQATIWQKAKFNAALFAGPHRISALDVDETRHTNKIGEGMLLYRQSFSEPHLHIWTERGYGYAEPFALPALELEAVFDAFCPLANITPTGTFNHPMRQVDQNLF